MIDFPLGISTLYYLFFTIFLISLKFLSHQTLLLISVASASYWYNLTGLSNCFATFNLYQTYFPLYLVLLLILLFTHNFFHFVWCLAYIFQINLKSPVLYPLNTIRNYFFIMECIQIFIFTAYLNFACCTIENRFNYARKMLHSC